MLRAKCCLTTPMRADTLGRLLVANTFPLAQSLSFSARLTPEEREFFGEHSSPVGDVVD
jgi:hypothetical protein